jgi:hypothetical protein
MAAFQIESNLCTGRGFIDTAATGYSGYMAHFYQWITTPVLSGGAGWYMLRDMSTQPVSKTVVPVVTGSSGYFTCSGHGFTHGDTLVLSATGTICGGYNNGYTYYVNKIDANKFRLYDSYKSAYANNLNSWPSNSGTGNQVIILNGPYVVVSNVSSPQVNQSCMILRVGYVSLTGSTINVQSFLSWDSVNQCVYGLWSGHRVSTADSSDFVYDFRGGAECMILQSRIASTWSSAILDTWTGDANFLEPINKSGVVSTNINAGTNVSIPLFSGESLNFTSGEYYYLLDFQSGHCFTTYSKCVGISGLSITLNNVYYNFPSGSIIGSYPHRFYTFGDYMSLYDMSTNSSNIPYYSSTTSGYVMHNQNSYNYGSFAADYNDGILSKLIPDDKGKYAIQRCNILESSRPNDSSYPGYFTDMNRFFGSSNNTYITKQGSMLAGSDGRTYGGKNYLFFMNASQFYNGASSNYCILVPDTETTS